MKTSSKTIVIGGLIAIAAFGVWYFVGPKTVKAPDTSSVATNSPSKDTVIPVSIVASKESASSTPSITIEYPQFPSLPASFNETISSSVTTRLADFKNEAAENDAARKATAKPGDVISPSDYSFDVSWKATTIDDRYVSFIIRYDMYTGGANENQEIETFNYDLSKKAVVTLADLFPGSADYLKQISDIARSQLIESTTAASNGNAPTDMISAGTVPTIDSFKYFTFNDRSVTIYFPKYAVAPGSFGEQKAMITRNSVK